MRTSLGMAMLATAIGLGLATTAQANETATKYSGSGLKVSNGDYSMAISTNMQQRLTIDDTHGAGSGSQGDSTSFGIRRLKSSFKGNVFNKKWSYAMTFAWNNGALENGNIGYKLGDAGKISIGSTKINFNLEEKNSSSRQTFVDRSLANEEFNLDFGHGIWFAGSSGMGDGKFFYDFGIYNGVHSSDGRNKGDNTGFGKGGGNNEQDFMINARFGITPFSDGKNIQKYMSDLRSDDKRGKLDLFLGLGLNYAMIDAGEGGAQSTADGDPVDQSGTVGSLAFDARMHYQGFSVSAAYFYRATSLEDFTAAGAENGTYSSGINITAGYNMNLENGDQLEFALRYSGVNNEDNDTSNLAYDGGDDKEEAGLAVNYRLNKDKLKLTFDANYKENTNNVTGIAPDDNFKDVEWQFRFQVQLKF